MTGRFTVVHWIDSSVQNGQVSRGDYPTPEVIRSIGWLVESANDHIVLARDDMKDDEYRGLLCIPKECIKSLKWDFADDRLLSSPPEQS